MEYSGQDRRSETTHCGDHTGQQERVLGLSGKIDALMWICGVGMALNIGIMTSVGVIVSTDQTKQASDLSIVRTNQQAVMRDVDALKQQYREQDKRIDDLSRRK